MARVLLTDGEQRSCLAVVRSLGRAGHEVHVTSVGGRSLAAASRHCSAEHRAPDPMADPRAFTGAVSELIDGLGIEVFVPMTDVSATVVLSSDLAGRHPELIVPFPPAAAWAAASDKRSLLEAARGLGVPVPAQTVVEARDDDPGPALEWAASIGFPVILKPHRSAVVTPTGVEKFGVSIAHSAERMRELLHGYDPAAYPLLVQERIQGPGMGGFFLAVDGRVASSFAHRRLREKPPTGGVSVLRESAPLAEDIARHSGALLRHFAWTGVAMIEFKQDARTGTSYLMEINGRFWGSLQLAIDAGVDFPRQLVDAFTGMRSGGAGGPAPGSRAEPAATAPESPDPGAPGAGEPAPGAGISASVPRTGVTPSAPGAGEPAPYRLGVRSRWLWGDVDHLLWILTAPRGYRARNPTLPGRLRALGRFLLPWTPGQRLEVLRLDDPRPFLRESALWFRKVIR